MSKAQKKNPPPPVPHHLAVRAAGPGGVDPRSVWKYLSGGSVRPLTRERVEAGLRAVGLGHLVRKDAEAAESAA
jgi:hypothetical protein